MLKIKDNVDLRKLKKYKLSFNGIELIGRNIFLEYSGNYSLLIKQTDTLYDLIQADLVEKVVE